MTDTDKLYTAIQEYIENRGGKVLVIGGIQIQQWSGGGSHRYSLAVQITGRKPLAGNEAEEAR